MMKQALCISIHDVAPPHWDDCARLLSAIREVAPLPATLLVVPAWHHRCHEEDEPRWLQALEAERANGSELALHGYTHLDEGRSPNCAMTYFWRHIYTGGEAEFAGLSCEQAEQRLAWGQEWFARQGWTPEGFVAPDWLLSAGSWRALSRSSLRYTCTFTRLHLLENGRSLFAPSLFYAGRNSALSSASRLANTGAAWFLREAPLLRLALQPRDACRPATLLHCQRLIERALRQREALTMAQFASRWSAVGSGMPSSANAAQVRDRPA